MPFSSNKNKHICKFIPLVLSCLLCLGHCYANDDVSWLNNQASLGFYDPDIMKVEFSGPSLTNAQAGDQQINNAVQGVIGLYQHLIYHSEEYFSMYWGVSAARWSRNNDSLVSASGFVSFRYWPIRTHYVSPYLLASVAGPTVISQQVLAGSNLGGNFMFQNILGLGVQLGTTQAVNIEATYIHYSNGQTFPINPGFNVPLALVVSYSF